MIRHRIFALVVAALLLALVVSPVSLADAPIRIRVNGQYLTNMDVSPVNINGRVFVPARFVAEALRATVDWDGPNSTVVVVSRPAQPPHWGREKGVLTNLTDQQIQDSLLFGLANKDKTWDGIMKGYAVHQPSPINSQLDNVAILRTEWQEGIWNAWNAQAKGKATPTLEEMKNILRPGYMRLEVYAWGDSDGFAEGLEAYLQQGNQIIRPVESYKDVDKGNTGYFQTPGIPSHYGDNIYLFSTNGLNLSGPLKAIVLSPAGQETRFEWNLYDLK